MSEGNFFTHAFSSLGDNLTIVGAVAEDTWDAWWSGSKDAPNTAKAVEEIRAREQGRDVSQAKIDKSSKGGMELIDKAKDMTVAQVGEKVGDVASGVGGILDLVTNKWFLGLAAAGVVLFVAAPYVGVLKKG